MIESSIKNSVVRIGFEKGSFRYSKIGVNSSDAKVLEFAKAINSIQAEVPKKIVRIVKSELENVI